MATWARVKAKIDDDMSASKSSDPMNGQNRRRASVTPGDESPLQASPAVPVEAPGRRVSFVMKLRERERQAWAMSEEERKKQDNEGGW